MDRSEAPVVEPGDTAKAAACAFLESLINKNIRIHTTDTRMFRGEFKCTDPVRPTPFLTTAWSCVTMMMETDLGVILQDRNVVLSHTYEYRQPSDEQLAAQAASASAAGSSDKVAVDMTSRYLGLVVVPGQYIVKMELEEFASQAKKQLA